MSVRAHRNPPQTTSTSKWTTTPHCSDTGSPVTSLSPPVCVPLSSQLASQLQLQLLGRSSVRDWTRLWPFGIPRRSAERGKASLKDTFPSLLCSNSIVLTGLRCPSVCQPSNLCVIEFPISHPSIMHLVPWGKRRPLLRPSAWRKETGFCPDWTERSITSWRSFPGLYHSQSQASAKLGLLCYVRRYHAGGWFGELKTLSFQTNSEISPRNIIIQWFISIVLCG